VGACKLAPTYDNSCLQVFPPPGEEWGPVEHGPVFSQFFPASLNEVVDSSLVPSVRVIDGGRPLSVLFPSDCPRLLPLSAGC